jgi:hypothetical protein
MHALRLAIPVEVLMSMAGIERLLTMRGFSSKRRVRFAVKPDVSAYATGWWLRERPNAEP